MIETLLWFLAVELTAGLVFVSYTLYTIQTDLAIIALHDCADLPDAPPMDVMDEPLILGATPIVVDDQDSIGTFTGAAWK